MGLSYCSAARTTPTNPRCGSIAVESTMALNGQTGRCSSTTTSMQMETFAFDNRPSDVELTPKKLVRTDVGQGVNFFSMSLLMSAFSLSVNGVGDGVVASIRSLNKLQVALLVVILFCLCESPLFSLVFFKALRGRNHCPDLDWFQCRTREELS